MKEKLDAEDIVGWRDVLLSDYKDIENQEQINALCGMALSSLTARDEADALLKYLLDRYDSGQSWDWADWNRVRDYLSRRQG